MKVDRIFRLAGRMKEEGGGAEGGLVRVNEKSIR